MKYLKKLVLFMTFVAIFCCLSLSVHAASLAAPKASVKTIASSGKVQISWGKVKQAKNYKVYYSTKKTGEYTLLGTTTGTKLTHSAAEAETTYYYYVRAAKGKTLSAKSKVVSATCDLPQPKIKLSNDADTGKIKIRWDAVEGAVKYKVYRATSKTGKYSLVRTTTGTSWTNTSTTAGKTHYYKVRAVASKSAADSAYSAISSRICDCARPVITISKTSAGKPKIRWKSVSGASKYQVYRTTSTTGKSTLVGTTTGTSLTDSSAKNGKTYYYKVRAVASKSAANSVYSLVKSVTAGETFVTSYVLLPNVYIYHSPSSDGKSIALKYMDKVQLGANVTESKKGTWTRLKYNNKTYYTWIPAGVTKFTTTKSSFDYVSEHNTALQNEVIQLALKYLELPTYYTNDDSSGKINPENGKYGFDCSGFASYVINTVMQKRNPLYKLERNTATLYTTGTCSNDRGVLYNEGFRNSYTMQHISRKDMQPGDVIFFKLADSAKAVDHCGIYLGNNEFIHCATTHDGVSIMPLTERFAEGFVAVCRYYPTEILPANQSIATNYSRVNLYTDRETSSERLYTFTLGEEATLLFTSSNGIWGYVRTKDGLEGYALMQRFDLVAE